jgi:hypothetical protein
MNIHNATVVGYSLSRCSGSCDSVTSSNSGPVSRLKKSTPRLPCSALRHHNLLWPLLTSGNLSRHLSAPIAQRQIARSPWYCARTFALMSVGYTPRRSVQVSGFASFGRLTPPRRLYPLRVPQTSALLPASFRPPVARTPLRSASTSPCRMCRGLSPPSACALPGAPKNAPRTGAGGFRGVVEVYKR